MKAFTIGCLFAPALLLAQSRTFVPVTSEMLANPSPNDWLMYNRTYDAQRYSPLKPLMTPSVIVLSLGICVAVGLIFGTAPAFRASRLSPIDSLRHE